MNRSEAVTVALSKLKSSPLRKQCSHCGLQLSPGEPHLKLNNCIMELRDIIACLEGEIQTKRNSRNVNPSCSWGMDRPAQPRTPLAWGASRGISPVCCARCPNLE